MTPDASGAPSDELILFDPPESGVPAFSAHFPVTSPTMLSGWPSTTNMKKSESHRGKLVVFSSVYRLNSAQHHHYKVLHGLYDTSKHA